MSNAQNEPAAKSDVTEGGPCKHCGRGLIWVGRDWTHDNHLGRCQSPDVPYGHLAEQVGAPCRADGPNPCLGAFTDPEATA